jgi:hypothetical protein
MQSRLTMTSLTDSYQGTIDFDINIAYLLVDVSFLSTSLTLTRLQAPCHGTKPHSERSHWLGSLHNPEVDEVDLASLGKNERNDVFSCR